MELRQLRYFAAVAEAGSFTAAARDLHISQPPLSVQIAKLEAEVGVTLLTRTAHGAEPTPAGRYLLDAASRVLGDVDDIAETLRGFGSGTRGTLTAAVVPALMWHRMPRVLASFAQVAPEVEVRLVDPAPWTAIGMLEDRAVDVALILVSDARRFAARHAATLQVLDVGAVPLVAALPPGSDAPDPLPLGALTGHTLVLPRRTRGFPSLPEAVDATLHRHGVTPAEVRTTETIQTALPLIEAGLAVGILPDADRLSLRRFDITVRELDPAPRPLRMLALTRRGAASDPALVRFVEVVRAG
jgi:DNA-binding transcriptional LysR family regulator